MTLRRSAWLLAQALTVSDRRDVSRIRVGQQVAVRLYNGLGNKVKGAFVAGEPAGITVCVKDEDVTIPWYKVRKVTARRKLYGLWLGMAIRFGRSRPLG